MSPSSASSDFPRLTGVDNFDVWKTRTRAYLDGKNLLPYVDDPKYDLHLAADADDNEDKASASDDNSNSNSDSEDAVGARRDDDDDDDQDRDSDDDEDRSSVAAANVHRLTLQDPQAQADGDANAPQGPVLPASARVESFETRSARQIAKARAKAAKATARAKAKDNALLVVTQTHRLDAQVKSFLMKTLDDKHIRIVKSFENAHDIYHAIRDRYKGTKAYGEPYNIMRYLYNA